MTDPDFEKRLRDSFGEPTACDDADRFAERIAAQLARSAVARRTWLAAAALAGVVAGRAALPDMLARARGEAASAVAVLSDGIEAAGQLLPAMLQSPQPASGMAITGLVLLAAALAAHVAADA